MFFFSKKKCPKQNEQTKNKHVKACELMGQKSCHKSSTTTSKQLQSAFKMKNKNCLFHRGWTQTCDAGRKTSPLISAAAAEEKQEEEEQDYRAAAQGGALTRAAAPPPSPGCLVTSRNRLIFCPTSPRDSQGIHLLEEIKGWTHSEVS